MRPGSQETCRRGDIQSPVLNEMRRRWGGRETPMTTNTAAVRTPAGAKSETLKAAFVAFFLGLGLVYGAGFANIESVHDAAHDSRHALSFPCH
jgi:cobalt transporter subunit CbtB